MEEASVAGESPDRSKQRESSAEPTSGSAVPVPEARDGKHGGSGDPRLALSREDAATAASGGGVDTATRVLSVPERTKGSAAVTADADSDAEGRDAGSGERDAEEHAAGDGAGRDEADQAAADDDAGNAARDERLRAAVAKWVTSTPDDADAKPEAEAAEADAPADATEDEGRASDDASGTANKDDRADRDDQAGETGNADESAEAAERTDSAAADATDTDGDREGGADADDAADAADSDDRDGDAPEADAKPEAPAGTDAKATDAPGKGEDTGETTEEGSDKPSAEAAARQVDQPTTMLKVGPSVKPAVDQPTTMLKVGKPSAAPAGDAERTSKFVALKPLDDPSTRKPAQPAQPDQPARPEPKAKAPGPAVVPADATAALPQVGPERTTQQPVPPKPPLDLLAELTNTPPPPQTPLRTLARRVKIWTPLVLLLVIVFAVVQAVRPLPEPSLVLTGRESYTFDGGKLSLPWSDEGQGWMDVDGVGTMDRFGEPNPVPIGSVAKTMTAYVILRDHPLKAGEEGPQIEVDALAEKEGGYNAEGESTLDTVKAGDKLTEKQALSAIMIPSANNIARLLARWDAGSEAAFVEKMNAAAKELGMTRTTYTDPSGLKETTVSTAEDQVKLGRAVVKIPALVAITSAASWTDPTGKYHNNYNELPYLIGAIGIKTGSTTKAGGNLLFASRREVAGKEVTIVGAVLGQMKPKILETANNVSKAALLAAQDALTSAKIVKKGDVVGYVDDGLGGRTPVVVTEDVTAVGWSGLKVDLSFAPGDVPHTAKAGTKVGTLTVGDGTSSAVKVPVALEKDLVEPGFGQKLTRIA
ncbi:D-alanyl-D-alanine carboxypeptidase [Streptomyces thermocoprophilus]|uniref:serine-type D-Ala-D-Ala carboxypeptidase n=1 Tax=Streptomyces thermocoprophilus TaxID=78356 RepID=A0ABV5VCM4_9ACTN